MEQNDSQTWRPSVSSSSIHVASVCDTMDYILTSCLADLTHSPPQLEKDDLVEVLKNLKRTEKRNILSELIGIAMYKYFWKMTEDRARHGNKHLIYDKNAPFCMIQVFTPIPMQAEDI